MSFSFVRGDALHDPLHVVTAIINPQRWRSRVKLYERFALHVNYHPLKRVACE